MVITNFSTTIFELEIRNYASIRYEANTNQFGILYVN